VQENKINNIASLNIIRAITSLIIVIYHAKFILWCGGKEYLSKIGLNHWFDYPIFALDMLSSNGEPIVVCFFILSGVVISHSYRKSKYAITTFYGIRLIRIYIPFISSILLSILALIAVHTWTPEIFQNGIREYNARLVVAWDELTISTAIKSLFYQKHNEFIGLNFVYWSLLHEVIFYLLYPLYHLIKTKGRIILLFGLILSFILTQNSIIYYQIYFLIGILIYDYFTHKNTSSLLKNKKLYLFIIGGSYLLMTYSFIHHWKISADIFSTILSIFAFDYVITFVKQTYKPIQKLAEFSYTLYLFHLPILLLTYSMFVLIFKEYVFYDRIFYYLGVIIAVFLCNFLFFTEKFSLFLIRGLKKKQ
jgi:peptidoglycan/LPS O-acetylase OafA/YrhL